MARKRMVTRTVEQTTAQVMTLDVTTAEVQVRPYDIGGRYTDEELLKKYDYPPDKQEKAIEIVMKQAKLSCEEIV